MFAIRSIRAVLGALLAVVVVPVMASQLAPQSADELAAAPRIVVADLESAQSRWNPQHTLILTDYAFRRVEILRGDFNERFVLTQGGGTVGNETHALSDLPQLQTGRRYLLILNAADNPVFSSVRYGAAGALEIDRDAARIRGGETLTDFRARVDRSAVIDDAALRPAPSGQSYPAAIWRPDEKPAAQPAPALLRPAEAAPAAQPPAREDGPSPFGRPAAVEPLLPFVPDYVVQRRPAPFITFNPLPLTWVWSPADQNQMAEWNHYGDIFRVQAPTGTWGWRNDRYDLAGFPGDADMNAQFGAPWGATTLAICYSRWVDNGPIVESDIAVNPAYNWTLDDAYGTQSDTTTPWSFRQALLHELGHSWGLQHPWETQNVFWPSTMNYGPKWARDPTLQADDTAAIHWAYPGIALHDGSLVMYRTDDSSASNNALYSSATTMLSSYTHGQSVGFSGAVTLQNLGTDNIVNPAVDVYLSGSRMAYDSAVYLGRSYYLATVPPFPNSLALLNLGSYFIDDSVPVGIYYPVIYLADSGGTEAYAANNSAWGRYEYPVTINNVTTTLLPTPAVQTTAIGRIGPRGQWIYGLNAQAGYTYTFATCGLAGFDTVLQIRGGFPTVADDDGCGIQSTLSWTSTSNQFVTVVVGGFSAAAQGAFQLAYSGGNDRIFAADFGG